MCLGTSHNVSPCLPPEPWSPPQACRYTYNPVIHTAGGVTGIIIGSAFALAIVFYISRKLIARIWLIMTRRCLRNRRLPSRLSSLFLAAGYSVPNNEQNISQADQNVIPNETNIPRRSVEPTTEGISAASPNLNPSFLFEHSDSRVWGSSLYFNKISQFGRIRIYFQESVECTGFASKIFLWI